MALLHKKEDQNPEEGAEGRQTLDPEKAHSTGEFIIVAKFGDHVLRHLPSNLLNVIRQAHGNSSLGEFII